jgi:SWI/SNF-related matrix-associated actin-dependent regulator 1 of chromatin subfamily A
VYVIGDAVLAKWAGLHKAKYVKRDGSEGERDAVNGMLTRMGISNLIVDEAHRFKTWKAQRTRAALALADTLPTDALRIIMTGTLSVNRAEEVVCPIRIAGVDNVFGGWFDMLNYYAPKIDRYGTRGSAHLDELHRIMVDNFYLRRTRDEVLTLPGKGRQLVAVAMTGKAATEYIAAQDDLIAYVRGTKGRKAADVAAKAEALVLLTTLRRLIAQAKLASTIDYVRDLVDDGEQVFVGTWHSDTTNALVKAFADVNSVRVAGDDTTTAKQAAVEAFQAGTARVLVGNIKAAGVGITLTAARHVVVAELPWTPGDLQQLEDRLDRIGQTRKVVSHIMLGTNGIATVDERLMGILNDKAGVTGVINDGQAQTIVDDDSITAALLNSYADEGEAA